MNEPTKQQAPTGVQPKSHEDVELRFGRGLISGYISALLGFLSLCGVLCFRFPDLLTSE